MKALIVAVGVLAGTVGLASMRYYGARAASAVPDSNTNLVQIEKPSTVARRSPQQAIDIAKGSAWGRTLAQGSNMTARYGAWTSGLVRTGGKGSHLEEDAPKGVWAVTVSGLNIPSHGPIGASGQLPARQYMTVIVDDKTGQVVMTEVY